MKMSSSISISRQMVSGLRLVPYDGTIKIWRLRDGFARVFRIDDRWPWAVRFNPNGRCVTSGYDSGEILIWDVRKGDLVAKWKGHDDGVSSLAFTPDGRGLLTASWDKTIAHWDATSLGPIEHTQRGNAENQEEVNSSVTEISRLVGHTVRIYMRSDGCSSHRCSL